MTPPTPNPDPPPHSADSTLAQSPAVGRHWATTLPPTGGGGTNRTAEGIRKKSTIRRWVCCSSGCWTAVSYPCHADEQEPMKRRGGGTLDEVGGGGVCHRRYQKSESERSKEAADDLEEGRSEYCLERRPHQVGKPAAAGDPRSDGRPSISWSLRFMVIIHGWIFIHK